MVANLCVKNKVSRMDIESNNGGDYYAKAVDEQIKNQGGNTSIRTFFLHQVIKSQKLSPRAIL